MKTIILSLTLFSLCISVALPQGEVLLTTGPNPVTRISTNTYPGGPAVGYTGTTAGVYYYALYASPVNSSINGNTNAIYGFSPNYVFDNLNGWILVGMATNPAVVGRIRAMSQGTTSANQGPLNTDSSLTVAGIPGGQYAHFVVLGWSAPGVGTNVEQLAAAYHNGYVGWIGQSAVSGAIQLGDGASISPSNVILATGPPYVAGFLLGEFGLLDGPYIYQQPSNVIVGVGSNATLNVGAFGPGTLTYTWYKNSQVVSVSSNSIYQIINATTNDAGQYYVLVASSIPNASVSSIPVTVTVDIPPSIRQQPVSQSVTVGTGTSLSVTASGTVPLNYQWCDPLPIFGATNSSLNFNSPQLTDWNNYFVIVTNIFGAVTSAPATLVVYQPVTILTQPVSQQVTNRSNVTLGVIATGYPGLTYQWSLNGTNIVGATNGSLTVSPVQLSDLGIYSVAISNGYSATNSAGASLYMLPTITKPFIGAIGIWGQDATLHVGAIGSGPLAYQWLFNGTAIAQATNADYVLPAIQFTNAGLYSVVVSSAYGSASNATFQVVVNPAEVSIAMRPSLTINGAVGYHYVIQGTFGLADTNTWVTLTNLTLSQQIEIWHDDGTNPTDPVNATRYYRVLPGQ